MEKENHIEQLLNSSNTDKELLSIAKKVLNNQRISTSEGVVLYQKGELAFLGMLANYVREKKNGDYVYFNRNFHIEPTNICVYTCSFCAYSRLIKQREEGWELSIDQMMDLMPVLIVFHERCLRRPMEPHQFVYLYSEHSQLRYLFQDVLRDARLYMDLVFPHYEVNIFF